MSKPTPLGAAGCAGIALGAVVGFLAGIVLAMIAIPISVQTPIRWVIVFGTIVVGMLVGGRLGKAIRATAGRRSTPPDPGPD
jgi:hypothetical protein